MFDETTAKKARVREIERTARQLADSVGKLLDLEEDGDTRGDWRGKRDAWKEEARQKWDYSRRMAAEKGREVDKYAHEHVWQTVGIAAALGAIVGSLLMKKRR